MLNLLIPFQILFIPGMILLSIWATYRTVIKKDRAVGLVFYISLVIIVDSYMDTGIFIPGLANGSIKYSEIVAIYLLLHNSKVKSASRINKLVLFLVAAYFILFFFAALRGITLGDGLANFRRFMVPQLLSFLVAYKGFSNEEDYKRFFFFLMIPILFIGLFTFWDVFFDRVFIHSERSLASPAYWQNRANGRFGSFFLNPNYMGGFFVLIFPVLFVSAVKQKELMKIILCWVGLLFFIFAFIKTQSRGPMLGFAVALFFFVIMPVKQYSFLRKIVPIILVSSLLYLAMPGFYKSATSRFEDIESESSMEEVSRKTIWQFTINNLIVDYPLFGIGLGEAQYVKYMNDYGFADEFGHTLDNPHGSYIQIAVMAGCIALLLFILINIIIIYKNALFFFENKDDERSLFLFCLTSGIMGFLFCLVVDMQMFTISVAPVFWLIVGLSFSISSSNSLISNTTVDSESGNDNKELSLSRHKGITVL